MEHELQAEFTTFLEVSDKSIFKSFSEHQWNQAIPNWIIELPIFCVPQVQSFLACVE